MTEVELKESVRANKAGAGDKWSDDDFLLGDENKEEKETEETEEGKSSDEEEEVSDNY